MPEGKASKGSGNVDLKVDGTAIGDGKAKIKGTLALPRLVVGDLKFVAEAKEGILRITSFGAGGKDIELSGDGRIQMRELATESVCDVNVKFKINDAYRGKDDKTKALFGAPGSNAPALFELADAKVREAKQPDGFYAFHVRGLLGRPDFAPASGGGAAPPGATGRFRGGIGGFGGSGSSGGSGASGSHGSGGDGEGP
jgi:type II secretion system protein N